MRQIRFGLGSSIMLALVASSCGLEERPPEAAPVSTDSPADPNTPAESLARMPEDSRIVATGNIALGGNGQVEVDSSAFNGMFIGIGIDDVQLCGDGRDATCMAACAEPCLAPGYPVGCGPCLGRGTFGGGIITASLSLVNTTSTGTYGECSLQDKTVCSTDALVDECAPNGTPNACVGNPVTSAGTLSSYDPEDTIPPGIMAGLCLDGSTACTAFTSDGIGRNSACGGVGICSDNGAPCSPGGDFFYGSPDDDRSLCFNPLTATCLDPGPVIGDGRCWSGCGSCTPGRPLNCASFVYTGSNSNAGPGDLKCTGAPYSLANPSSGPNTIIIGTVPQPGSLPFQIQINAGDSSYCVHTFQIQDDPYGDLAGFGCTATCGDGYIAVFNGEVCEPAYDYYLDPTPMIPNDKGCDDVNPTCYFCGSCVSPPLLCGNGVTDSPTEICDDGILNNTCGNCNFICTGPYTPYCGDGYAECGETCDDGLSNGTSGFCNNTCSGITP